MIEPTSTTRCDAFVRWLLGDIYVFRHEETGATHAVRARSADAAKEKMRGFLQQAMYGGWAIFYDPVAVEKELSKCKIV